MGKTGKNTFFSRPVRTRGDPWRPVGTRAAWKSAFLILHMHIYEDKKNTYVHVFLYIEICIYIYIYVYIHIHTCYDRKLRPSRFGNDQTRSRSPEILDFRLILTLKMAFSNGKIKKKALLSRPVATREDPWRPVQTRGDPCHWEICIFYICGHLYLYP